jgi:hypothetical protein
MASIDVSRFGGNPIPAFRKLKRVYERQSSPGGFRSTGRHKKKNKERREAKLAAVKRSSKARSTHAKTVLSTSRRYRNLSIKQVIEKLFHVDK